MSSSQPLLDTESFRFVGDDSAWQQQNGQAKMTAVKDYVVEVKTKDQEHLLLKFKLVYDWLVFCHVRGSRRARPRYEATPQPWRHLL